MSTKERLLWAGLVPLLAGFALWASKSGGHDRWTPVRPGIYYVEPIGPGPLFWLVGLMLVTASVAWAVLLWRTVAQHPTATNTPCDAPTATQAPLRGDQR